MLHGYGYAYRYRKDTDTRIRQFPEKTDTWIRLIIKKIKINKYNAGLNLKLIAIKLIAIYGRKYYYYITICLKYRHIVVSILKFKKLIEGFRLAIYSAYMQHCSSQQDSSKPARSYSLLSCPIVIHYIMLLVLSIQTKSHSLQFWFIKGQVSHFKNANTTK